MDNQAVVQLPQNDRVMFIKNNCVDKTGGKIKFSKADARRSITDGYLQALILAGLTGRTLEAKESEDIAKYVSIKRVGLQATNLSPEMDISKAERLGIPILPDTYALYQLIYFLSSYARFNTVMNRSWEFYKKLYIDKDTKERLYEPEEGRRLREINSPNPTLRLVHRVLGKEIFSKLPVHPANHAYMRGRNTVTACNEHVGKEITIAVDIHDFFGSHNTAYVRDVLAGITGYSNRVAGTIARACTLMDTMPQGTVVSPQLCLALNYELDTKIHNLATEHNLVYTRYSDDLHFSGVDRDDKYCHVFIGELNRLLGSKFNLSHSKTRILRTYTKRYMSGFKFRSPQLNGRDLASYLLESGIDLDSKFYKFADYHDGTYAIKIRYRLALLAGEPWRRLKAQERALHALFGPLETLVWYDQGTRKLLGLTILKDRISYPRKAYTSLRKDMMMLGLRTHNKPFSARGMLSYIKMVDEQKYNKLFAIMNKFAEKRRQILGNANRRGESA